MKRRTVVIVAVLALLANVGFAAGQTYVVPRRHEVEAYHVHRSTLEEGVLAGYGEYWRGAGAYNLNTAQAMIAREEARSRAIENWKKYVETYFEVRKINQQARAAERGPRPTPEQMNRYAQIMTPARLTPAEFNRQTRELVWPLALRGEEYLLQRLEVERLVQEPGRYGEQGPQIERLAREMRETLITRVREMPAHEFMAANAFLKGLAYEGRLMPEELQYASG